MNASPRTNEAAAILILIMTIKFSDSPEGNHRADEKRPSAAVSASADGAAAETASRTPSAAR